MTPQIASRDWLDTEDKLGGWRRELARVKRRARNRLGATFALGLVATAAALFVVHKKVPPQESRVLIRVTESTLLRDDAPLASGELADYLWDAAFSNGKLLRLIDKHDLYPLARTRGEDFVLETIRWDLDVEVFRNYFIAARNYNDPVRTARIAVKYRHRDPDLSMKVARDLAQLVIDTEEERRQRSSQDIVGVAGVALARAVEILDKSERDLAACQAELQLAKRKRDQQNIARLQVDLTRLTADVKRHHVAMRQARDAKQRADFQYALDMKGVGLVFQIVDERPPPPPPETSARVIRFAMIGLACFVLLLPLCAIAVGAFDQRVHDREDVQRLGIEVVGHVPAFDGSDAGSMRSRLIDRRRVRARRGST